MKKIALLGSTGSIGTQVLNVVTRYPDKFSVISLSANNSAVELEKQINIFKPKVAVLTNPKGLNSIKEIPSGTSLYYGENSLLHAILPEADIVFVALSGFVGMQAVKCALEMGKTVALANKESLVAGGELLMPLVKFGGDIIPVDSEHSAIWQCLNYNRDKKVKNLLITASGGAFRTLSREEIMSLPPERALNHPNWKMGKKITVDCATMMNKGLEVIEARWLFNTPVEKIKVVVHPQSVIHSMVSFDDGVTIAQLSYPTMEIPIQLSLTYPERLPTNVDNFDFYGKSLTFEELDSQKFPCFDLAIKSIKMGKNMPCAMSGANEEAVRLYLEHKIGFYDISNAVSKVLDEIIPQELSFESLYETDKKAREIVLKMFGEK